MGVFHPLLIHFPIALLMLSFLLEIYALWENGKKYKVSIPFITLLGSAGAVLSSISGYFLMNSGDYETATVLLHRNWGIALAVSSVLIMLLYKYPPKIPHIHLFGQAILSSLVIITGHLGGNLTHGEDFLSFDQEKTIPKTKNFKDNDLVYDKIVAPILEEKCVACHGKSKQKSKLRLDNLQNILKGGKNGFYHGEKENKIALMAHRINLPSSDKYHMPPKGKSQLSDLEKVILEKWLAMDASSTIKYKDLNISEQTRLHLDNQSSSKNNMTDWPASENLSLISEEKLIALRDKGFVILPLAKNHPLIQVNALSIKEFGDENWEEFNKLEKNIASLRLSDTKITDKSLQWIGKLPNLTKLYLDHTSITDKGLMSLKNAKELRYLNLVGTKVTINGLLHIKDLPNLRSVYLYQSEVDIDKIKTLQKKLPQVYFDLGGYKMDTLTL